MKLPLRLLVTYFLATVCNFSSVPAPACAEEENEAAVPLSRVVMFSSGVAFYERNGEIEGNAQVDLKFNVEDVNDLLKSMVLQDLGGGRISSVAYGSQDPITRTLKTFAVDLTTNPTLADLLNQIRGEKIELDAPAQVSGVILGVEKKEKPVGDQGTVETAYLNLLTEEGLRRISLANVGRIKLSDPKLDAELRQALLVLAQGNSTDKKTVSLKFLGEGKRKVRVGYIQESPIWKTSYRLVLSEENPPLLQGWAIVENTTENDWKNVGLTLVSGRPISFVMDLYQPLYVSRPLVQPELYASLRPRVYDQDLDDAEQEFTNRAGASKGEALAKAPAADAERQERQMEKSRGRYLAEETKKANKDFDPGQGVRSVAQSADVGEMFQYTIATPVNLERQKSAMLPIVNESIEGEKLSIYNPDTHAKHPLNGLRLKNTTDLHLMQGPITVFDDGAYAGDSQIQDIPAKSERLISYALDLNTEIAPSSKDEPTEITTIKLTKGVLQVTRRFAREQSYVVKNSGAKTKQVLIEYPIDTAWKLTEPEEPVEKTRNMYRFQVKAEPGEPANLKIRQQRSETNGYGLNNLDENSIRYYVSAKVISEEIKEALGEAIKRKQALAQLVKARQELERQVEVIFQEQARIRQNMAKLPQESDLYRRYIAKFNDQETEVETLRTQIDDAIAAEQKSQKGLDEWLIGLNLE